MRVTLEQQRNAETSMAVIYLDWATRAADKAASTTDPEARMFYRNNALRDYEAAIHYLSHQEER